MNLAIEVDLYFGMCSSRYSKLQIFKFQSKEHNMKNFYIVYLKLYKLDPKITQVRKRSSIIMRSRLHQNRSRLLPC